MPRDLWCQLALVEERVIALKVSESAAQIPSDIKTSTTVLEYLKKFNAVARKQCNKNPINFLAA